MGLAGILASSIYFPMGILLTNSYLFLLVVKIAWNQARGTRSHVLRTSRVQRSIFETKGLKGGCVADAKLTLLMKFFFIFFN